jgi:hypothetical protein
VLAWHFSRLQAPGRIGADSLSDLRSLDAAAPDATPAGTTAVLEAASGTAAGETLAAGPCARGPAAKRWINLETEGHVRIDQAQWDGRCERRTQTAEYGSRASGK